MRVLKSLYSECARAQIFFFLLLQDACIQEKKHFKLQSNYTRIPKLLVQFDILALKCIICLCVFIPIHLRIFGELFRVQLLDTLPELSIDVER